MRTRLVCIALATAACSSSSPSPQANASPSTIASPSPSVAAITPCAALVDAGTLVKHVRKGLGTPSDMIDEVAQVRASLAAAQESLLTASKSIRILDVHLAGMARSIEAAGANYPYDRAVKLSAEAVSLVALTGMMELGC